jgi:DNA polymerase/3'-5' exonuclease PolX
MRQLMQGKSNARSINASVASRLDEVAQILDEQGANVFRVGAYRRAAAMLRGLQEPIDQIVKSEGLEGSSAHPRRIQNGFSI